MNQDERSAFAAQLKAAVDGARKRGLEPWGYSYDAGRLELWTRPKERKRRPRAEAPPAPPAPEAPRIRRGAIQGTLL
jgi:hypothetical protein